MAKNGSAGYEQEGIAEPLREGLGDEREAIATAAPTASANTSAFSEPQREQRAGRVGPAPAARPFPQASQRSRCACRPRWRAAIVRDDVGPADVDRAEAFRRLLADAPQVRLAHPHDRVARERRVIHELREAEQVVGLVGAGERRREHGVEDGQARGTEGGGERRLDQRPVVGQRPGRGHGPRRETRAPRRRPGARRAPPSPISQPKPGAIRHMWLSRTIRGSAWRVVDERPAHVERLRLRARGGRTWSGAGSVSGAGRNASRETRPSPVTSTSRSKAAASARVRLALGRSAKHGRLPCAQLVASARDELAVHATQPDRAATSRSGAALSRNSCSSSCASTSETSRPTSASRWIRLAR